MCTGLLSPGANPIVVKILIIIMMATKLTVCPICCVTVLIQSTSQRPDAKVGSVRRLLCLNQAGMNTVTRLLTERKI